MLFALILGYGVHFSHPHVVGYFDYRTCVTNGRVIEAANAMHRHMYVTLTNGRQFGIDHSSNRTQCVNAAVASIFTSNN